MNEYFKTKATFRKFYEGDTDNNYSGLVDGATYDITIKFGRDETQIPTKEMAIGLCDEIITITDINTEKKYKYSSFNDAFNAWELYDDDERFLNGVDDRHNTYKIWHVPNVYVVANDIYYIEDIFDKLCEDISCIPILANVKADDFVQDGDYYKALSIEVDKMLNSQYIIMGNRVDYEKTILMKITECVAEQYDIPIIYTEDPTKNNIDGISQICKIDINNINDLLDKHKINIKASPSDNNDDELLYQKFSQKGKSYNVNVESSDNVKSDDLVDSLDN